AIGMFAYLKYDFMKWPKEYMEPTVTKTLERVDDPTSDWKTYINSEYGFSFKYPPEFIFFEETEIDDDTVGIVFRHRDFNNDLELWGTDEFNEDSPTIRIHQTPLSTEEFL